MNEAKRPHRWWRRLAVQAVLLLAAFAVLLLAAAGAGLYIVYDNVQRERVAGMGEPVAVDIPQGATGGDIAELLTKAGLIEHPFYFRVAMRFSDEERFIRHGRYELPPGLSASQLLELLHEGPQLPVDAFVRVRVPEGMPLRRIAETFDDPDAFLLAATDPDLLAEHAVPADSFEGFLLAETYFFDEPPTPREVVGRAADHFEEAYEKLLREHPEAAARGPLEIVTVASLVEMEGKTDDERAAIAGVIYNRLERGMPLEMDATLQYISGRYGEWVLYRDKEVDSPYNTYIYPGLPPGPIATVSEASLRAAMNPAEHEYLFFVSNADGKTHTFSETLAEHNQAVARFRREIAEQRRAETP